MEGFLNIVNSALQWLINLGASALVPLFLFFLVICLGVKPGKAARAALTVGVGFVGIFTMVDLFFDQLAPVAEAMVSRFDLSLNTIDVGWGPYMGAIWASPLSIIFLSMHLVVNLVLIFTKLTDTLNIDIWNYCLNFYAGMLTYVATGNMALAIVAFLISEIISLKLADMIAPKVQEYFGLPGITFPHVVSLAFLPIGWLLAKLLDRIPVIKDLDADPDTLKKRFGIFGEPIFLGFVIGIVIPLLGGQSIAESIALGVTMAAVMILLPRMVSVLVEGLAPLTEVIRDKFQKLMPGRSIHIGLDTAITIGHPSTLAAGVLLVPISLLLAAVLPFNRVIPFGDLASITFAICLITPYVKGNVVKLLIIGTLIVAFVMLPVSTLVAPEITQMVKEAGMYSVPEGFGEATMVTAFLDGGNPLSFIIYKIVAFFSNLF